jgi:lipoprotein-anchoring transpeptidase ErfK/SrfK
MAINRTSRWLFVAAPLFVIASALAVTAVTVSRLSDRRTTSEINAVKSLPADPGAAKKEVRKAHAALEKLAPRGAYIVINTHANRIVLRTRQEVLLEAPCSTGSGDTLVDSVTDRTWVFDTPRGKFKITDKLTQPWWRKPDWAFIEEGEEIPKDPSKRLDPEVMGDYALGFGDGYFIHGTIYERLIGVNVTHGCVRLASEDLGKLYRQAPVGTPVYIF